MIHLITGVPGSGKTLYTVWWLQKEVAAGRRLVVNGVKDLLLDHELVDDDWVRDWHNRCQQNDIVLVDEVQRIWPPVSSSVKPTEDIEQLHVHRHRGVDFVVITQHPNRMNKTVRDLVGRHVHVRKLFGLSRAMLYQWDMAHNPNSGFRDAVKTMWAYPKSVYKLYTSAEMHTKPKAVIPKALFVLPIAAVVAMVLTWKGLHGVNTGFGIDAAKVPGAASGPAASGAAKASAGPVGGGVNGAVSNVWRVAGRYAIDGRGYVLLTDTQGHFRRESSDDFRGETLGVTGIVDGERVAVWSGATASSDNAVGGHK
ncbi:zonular occludens toxin domain-containing protein [Paraburkholderia agricolaris]|uniref:zonular occludens toxin domain-containing protein n=1 Tax=Paraburkholderia agricolaris TaxID=2152888 RepID=UPI001290F9BE|nr:zonular occludens toxin domain-containing protein [Paraburkholderia agricolaris]